MHLGDAVSRAGQRGVRTGDPLAQPRLGFGLTLVFTLIVMVFLRFKLRGVDMVSSLKSVE